ncbi:MAG TPA: 50S ribosomal protein L21 [Candidatus Saccharimonadales bacterium]|nr:50S ribosomal protein L21 [Candidatus Saccharimonadales bacterium]
MAEKLVKKAVINTGGKQYLVTEGQELEVELLAADKKPVFEPILVISGSDVMVGTPAVSGAQVKADVVEAEVKQDKVTAIRYKAKKRVNKRRGHRQKLSRIKVTAISAK